MLVASMLNVLLTNDDGIEADGLQAMRRALAAVEGVRLAVIAPDGNRSAMARSITTRRPLWVAEVPFEDGTVGYATDGTPVDCVRLASLGLIEGFKADLVVAGINHGANLGDDITYSGTVAAALEGVVLGLPAIAVSQQSGAGALDYRFDGGFGFDMAAASWRGWWSGSRTCRCPRGRCSTSTCPGASPGGGGDEPRQAHLPRRAEARARGEEAAGATGSTAPTPASTTSPAPTSRRWPRGGSR